MIAETIPPSIIDLRAWRLRAGYQSMTEVARLIGYSDVSAVGRMERGERPIPRWRLPLLEELFGPNPPMMDKPNHVQEDDYWTFWWEYTVELTCPHCARYREYVVKTAKPVRITYIPRLRCNACGAHLVVADITSERKRKPKPRMYVILDSEIPRRGRPPKKRQGRI